MWFSHVEPVLLYIRACSSVVERCPDKTEVDGPIPSMLTVFFMSKNLITIIFVLILLAVQVFFFVYEKKKDRISAEAPVEVSTVVTE